MTIQAFMKCRDIRTSLEFYTNVMDFSIVTEPDPDPNAFMSKYALLSRGDSHLHLSSHEGDGVFGNLIYVQVEEVDALFYEFVSRGINTEQPDVYPAVVIPLTEQTWGMKEFSIRDPDGNKITFGQKISN